MPVVPLQVDPHNSQQFLNIADFMNSLFDSDVRTLSVVQSAIEDGKKHVSFADDDSAILVLRSWLAAWQHSQGDTTVDGYDSDAYHRCPSTDRDLIGFLAGYIKQHNLQLASPDLTAVDKYYSYDGQSLRRVYSNSGYRWMPFISSGKWNYGVITSRGPSNGSYPTDTVAYFLYKLMFGAHFVVVSDDDDLHDGDDGFQGFRDAFTGAHLADRGTTSSHYTGTWSDTVHLLNTSCLTYLDINQDSEPSSNPLIASFMLGNTTDLDSNAFFQLEGWPLNDAGGGTRHGADYDSHLATLWNFSTFGASVYSEKRSTPLFLTRTTFSTTIQSDTHMPHYNGAGSHQNWMHTELLQYSS